MTKTEKKVRAKPKAFIVPEDFIEGVVSLNSVVRKERKTKIDYEAIKNALMIVLENGETPVYFMKKSAQSMSTIKAELEKKYDLKIHLVKVKSGQIGLSLKP
jgi:hypothetical protein